MSDCSSTLNEYAFLSTNRGYRNLFRKNECWMEFYRKPGERVRMQQVNQIVDSFLGHIPISTPQLENLTVQALQTLLRGSIFSVDDSTPKPLIQEECNRAGRGRIFFYSCIVSVHNVYLNAILLVKQIQNRTTSLNRTRMIAAHNGLKSSFSSSNWTKNIPSLIESPTPAIASA